MTKNSGFTLIEMLVVIVLVAVVGFILLNVFISHDRIYKTQSAELDISGDIRASLDDIDNYVRQATRTLSTYSTYNAGPQVLILQVQSISGTNQIVPGKYDYVVYTLTQGVLSRQIFADPSSSRVTSTKILTSRVTNLTFTYNNIDYTLVTQVNTDLTEAESIGAQTKSINYNSNAKLRNY